MTVEALAGPDERTPAEPGAGLLAAAAVAAAAAGAGVGVGAGAGAGAGAGQPIGVRMLDRGIIEVTLPANQEIEGPEARVAGGIVRELAGGRRMPVLLVITGILGVSVEARHVYATCIAASAFALVGESPVDRVIAHYLLRSRSETIPAEFFTSEEQAVEWLGQYASED